MLGFWTQANRADLVLEWLARASQRWSPAVVSHDDPGGRNAVVPCADAHPRRAAGWYAVTHPETGRDRTIGRMAHLLYVFTFGLTEYLNPSAEGTTFRGEVPMDKPEAERLIRAIERMHVAWLQVDQIVFNETRHAYELKCSYRGPGGRLGARAVWRTRWISSPREWIDLLTKQHDTL